MYGPMLARIAMRYVFSNQRIDRRMCTSNKAHMFAYPKLSMLSPTAPRYTLCSHMTGSTY
eukprot:1152568-Pelagomonas_calceolata.AAC.1